MPRKYSLTHQESWVLSLAEEGIAIRVMWNDEGRVPWKKKKRNTPLTERRKWGF